MILIKECLRILPLLMILPTGKGYTAKDNSLIKFLNLI